MKEIIPIKHIKELSIGLFVAILVIITITIFGFITDNGGPNTQDNTVALEELIKETTDPFENDVTSSELDSNDQKKVPPEEVNVVVDVKGAVKVPGVFTFTSDQRVIDAIEAAGGLSDNADPKQVNFAQLLSDEMYIYIPEEGEETVQVPIALEKNQSDDLMIDINKAEESELLLLDGIGPSKAGEIVRYRETNGRFQSIEDLTKVTGIGEKTFEKLKDKITVN
ncbi:MAG: helix-hairpin-helix domain-containing protein [Alkalibacterium sp.]